MILIKFEDDPKIPSYGVYRLCPGGEKVWVFGPETMANSDALAA